MNERWHIIDKSCTDGGERDWGSFEFFWQAAEHVRAFIAKGIPGGCRCHRGWKIVPCSKLRDGHGGGYIRGSDCVPFDEGGRWNDKEDFEWWEAKV